jgi:acyl-CoA dehydrogenase
MVGGRGMRKGGRRLVSASDELREVVRQFASRECGPAVVREYRAEARPPLELVRRLGDVGLLRLGLPESAGGEGGVIELAVLHEELARVFVDLAHLAGRVTYLASAISAFGSPSQRARWLGPLLRGELIATLCYTEPEAGSDLFSLRTKAEPTDAGFKITGRKIFSSSFGYADVAVVAAKVGSYETRDAISLFLVDPKGPGIASAKLDTLGHPCEGTYEVSFDGVRVTADQCLGEIGGGRAVMSHTLGRERLLMSARAVGATVAALDLCSDYVKVRKQFGRALKDFQVLRHRIADMAISADLGRTAVEKLAQDIDAGIDNPLRSAATKIFTTENAVHAADTAVQIFGGYGYVQSDVQQLYRDARVYTIGGGTSEVLRESIGRQLLGAGK